MLRTGVLLLSLLFAGCASMPPNNGRIASHAYEDTAHTPLGQYVQELERGHPGQDGFVLLPDGLDAFVARATLIEHARRSIDVQYYLYHQDQVGRLFTALLLQAADRGVRVRILVDDMDMGGRDKGIAALDAHPNIEIRLFNPFNRHMMRLPQFVTGLGKVTRRMHNKLFVVDNQVAILGGRNIGDEYFAANPTLEFADLDVLTVGPVVPQASRAFDLYWNSPLAWPAATITGKHISESIRRRLREEMMAQLQRHETSVYLQALHDSPLALAIRHHQVAYRWGRAVVLVDHPDKISSSRDANQLHLVTKLEPFFRNLQRELIIISPYFVPGEEGLDFFRQLIGQGVRVRILTNSLASNDVMPVHAGYVKYRRALVQMGVELYEMNRRLTREQRREIRGTGGSSKASLHAKVFVLDRSHVFIGSLNLDPRSFYENSEIGLLMDAPSVAEDMARQFDRNIDRSAFRLTWHGGRLHWHGTEQGQAVEFDSEPYAGFWRRFGVLLLQWLPIESQL